jgi:hypothetical protein
VAQRIAQNGVGKFPAKFLVNPLDRSGSGWTVAIHRVVYAVGYAGFMKNLGRI